MFDPDIIRLLFFISLPFLIDKGREFMRQRELNLQKPKRNKTKFDYFTIILLLSNSLLQTYFAIFLKPPNIYRDNGVPLKMSTSILRTIFMENNNKTTFNDKEQTLLKKLESYENRLIYVTYGEEALLECSYCYNLTDYLMFIIPNIAWSYVIMTSILGVTTMLKRKSHWRTYGVIWLVGSGFLELYTFSTVDFSNLDSGEFLYCTIEFYRRLSFSILSLAILLFDKIDERNNFEIITDMKRTLETIINRSKALNLQRTSILRDSNLRRLFVEYYKRVEMDDNIISLDSEYKEAKNKALSKLNVENLLKEAELYVDDITKLKELGSDTDLAVGIQSTSTSNSILSSSSSSSSSKTKES